LRQQHHAARFVAAIGSGFLRGRHIQHGLPQGAVVLRPFQPTDGVVAKHLGFLLHRRTGPAAMGDVHGSVPFGPGLRQLRQVSRLPAFLKQALCPRQDGANLLIGLGLVGPGCGPLLGEQPDTDNPSHHQQRQGSQQSGSGRATPHPFAHPLGHADRPRCHRLAPHEAPQVVG
jgi:hypothetical protein